MTLIGEESPAIPVYAAEKPTPKIMTQYGIYEDGYLPASRTIPKLPTGIYKPVMHHSHNGSTLYFRPLTVLTDDLIQFTDSVLKEIVEEVKVFWSQKDKYEEYGFRHKRGYLLHGAPGSGKSCLINMFVEEMLKHDSIVLYGGDLSNAISLLPKFREVEPNRPIMVIFEDIDTSIKINRDAESALLSLLDGETKLDNVVYVATTNYPEDLEERMLNRPGRFDRIIEIELPNDEMRTQYFMAKVGTTKGKDGSDFVKMTKGLSLGHLREFVVEVFIQGKNPGDVAGNLQNMKQMPKSKHIGSGKYGMNLEPKIE